MCGIVGFTGQDYAVPKIVKGLECLEYRGYDSAGISVFSAGKTVTVKQSGRVERLKQRLKNNDLSDSVCGIGHTRWATHGGPSDVNAHPHTTARLCLVHNGIIENYLELKNELSEKGIDMRSQTDTEVAANIITLEYEKTGDPVTAVYNAIKRFKGTYAFGIMFNDVPDKIYAVRCGSPLILGEGQDGSYIASDMTALLPFTDRFCSLTENCVAVAEKDGFYLVLPDGVISKPHFTVTEISASAAEKGGYDHFMLKEIHEQPAAVLNAINPRIKDGLPDFSADGLNDDFFAGIQKVYIVACGSAMHAGLVGRYFTEHLAKLPVMVEIASEFRYNSPLLNSSTLVIVVSQSGETADTLAALRYSKQKGAKTLSIVNVVGSAIAREADVTLYTSAGPEIAVATTKGYTTQVAVLTLLAYKIALVKKAVTQDTVKTDLLALVNEIGTAFENAFALHPQISDTARLLATAENLFYIGRGIDSALSVEGSLKLKEISYIHSESYAAGELKHGTISLITRGMPVIALSTSKRLFEKTVSNIQECASRGAYTVLICCEDAATHENFANSIIKLPNLSGLAQIFCAVTVMQLIAYETAVLRGCDIDRPRNLAKSVTVE